MKLPLFASAVCLSLGCVLNAAVAEDMVALKTELPPPLFVGTPVPINLPNLEPARAGKRPDFMVPSGTVNLAKGKKVTSSDSDPALAAWI